jgi:transcriptional regulator with XRE-family HTH domain
MTRKRSDIPSTTALRHRHGWTQAQLAQFLGVDTATVSRWERGASRPRVAILAALARLATTPPAPIAPAPEPEGAGDRRFASDASIDELVRFVGIDRARGALRALALQSRAPEPLRFTVDPTERLRQLDDMLDEQRELIARAEIR